MLIDTREPEPQPEPRRRGPDIDWSLWFWSLESVALFVASAMLTGFVSVALTFAGFIAGLKALEILCGGPSRGLMDWHQ